MGGLRGEEKYKEVRRERVVGGMGHPRLKGHPFVTGGKTTRD
jgi:hypothetical protein